MTYFRRLCFTTVSPVITDHKLTAVKRYVNNVVSDQRSRFTAPCIGDYNTPDTGVSIFTALHGMQTRSSDENSVRRSVRLSVCLSNACIVTKRKKDMSRFLYYSKDHLA